MAAIKSIEETGGKKPLQANGLCRAIFCDGQSSMDSKKTNINVFVRSFFFPVSFVFRPFYFICMGLVVCLRTIQFSAVFPYFQAVDTFESVFGEHVRALARNNFALS